MGLVAGIGGAARGVGSRALDLALPPRCAGCRREGSPLCRECRSWLLTRVAAPAGVPIGIPAEIPPPLVQLEWCAPFTGTVRRAVHDLKYAGERRLATVLGEVVAERWRRAGAGGDLLVPVPASPDRIRERGYDQAVLLAEDVGRRLRLPVVDALERVHVTEAQHALGRSGRAQNVGHVFQLRAAGPGRARAARSGAARSGAARSGTAGTPAARAGTAACGDTRAMHRVAGQWIVLVDDVVTTGATLGACGTVLLDAGAAAVSAITVARER